MTDRRVKLILEAQVDQFNSNLRRAQNEAEGLGQKLQKTLGSREMQQLGRHMVAFGAATVGALGLATKAAMDWDTAWIDVVRRTEGTPQQLAALEDGLRGLAREMPATHAEIAEVAASAAQLGVSVNDVEAFTEVMVMMGATTNMSADQAATAMARFANVMGTSHSDFDNMGSAIVDLGNNAATTESEIMDMAQRIAGAGNAMGMSEGEVLGFATALSSVGVQAAAGGTAISRTMYDIDSAVSQGGEALMGFAEIAGMSSEEFSRLWAEDAASGMEAFISGLGRIQEEGGSVAQALEAVGISEVRTVAAMTQMASAGDMLGESLARGNQAFEENSAMAAEYAYIQETVAAQIQVFWNRVYDTAIDIGATILPILERLVIWAGEAVTWFSNLSAPVRNTATVMALLAGSLSLVLGTAILLAPGILATTSALGALVPAGGRARTALTRVGRGAGIALAGLVGLMIANEIFDPRRTSGNAEDFANALDAVALGANGASDQLQELSQQNIGYGISINGIGHAFALQEANGFQKALAGIGGVIPGLNNYLTEAGEITREYDAGMAQLISSGNLEAAGEGFVDLANQSQMWNKSTDEIVEDMPQFEAALRDSGISAQELNEAMGYARDGITEAGGAAEFGGTTFGDLNERLLETEQDALAAAMGLDEVDEAAEEADRAAQELADALDEVGLSADGAVTSLKDFLDVLFEAGILTMDAREATSRFHEAIRNADDALQTITESQGEMGRMLNQNKTDFDLTTEAGKLANEAFQDITRSGFDAAQAMAENGASQDEVQGKLKSTYDSLIETAIGFGISEDAAIDLTREVMGIPSEANIDSWMSEEAKRVAEETNAAIDRVDGRSTFSTHRHTITEVVNRVGGSSTGSMFGNALNRATGGPVIGPGTGTSDDIPAWLSNGEHFLTAKEVGLMGGQQGVYDFRRSLTGTTPQRPSGRDLVPTYATGGAVTRGSAGNSGPMSAEASLVGARIAMDSDGFARFVDGRVKVSMGDPSVLRKASQGLAEQSRRDSRRG